MIAFTLLKLFLTIFTTLKQFLYVIRLCYFKNKTYIHTALGIFLSNSSTFAAALLWCASCTIYSFTIDFLLPYYVQLFDLIWLGFYCTGNSPYYDALLGFLNAVWYPIILVTWKPCMETCALLQVTPVCTAHCCEPQKELTWRIILKDGQEE